MRISTFLLVFFTFQLTCIGDGFTVFEKDGRYGLKDDSGQVTVPAVYEMLGWSNGAKEVFDGVIGYERSGRWGLISSDNKVLTETDYYSLVPLKSGFIKASIKGKFSNLLFYGLLSTKGEIFISFNYTGLDLLDDLLIVSSYDPSGTKYGGLSLTNQLVIPLEYKRIGKVEHWYTATGFDNQHDIFNRNGRLIAGIQDYYPSEEGLVCIRNGFKGLVSAKGLIYDCEWKEVSGDDPIEFPTWQILDSERIKFEIPCDSIQYNNGLWTIHRNGTHHLQYYEDQKIFQEVELENIIDDKLIVSHPKGHVWSLLNSEGKEVISHQDSIFSCGSYFVATRGGEWNLYNGFGTKINRFSFDQIAKGIESHFLAKRNNYWGVIDFSGAPYLTFKYDSIQMVDDEFYLFNFLGKCGVMNKYGNWLHDPEYQSFEIFGDFLVGKKGLAYTYIRGEDMLMKSILRPKVDLGSHLGIEDEEGRIGLLDKNGSVLIEPRFRSIRQSGKLFILEDSSGLKVANTAGDILNNKPFKQVGAYSEGLLPVSFRGRWGFINDKGDFSISNRYEEVGAFNEGMAPIKLRGRWGFINKREVLKVQPFYDAVSRFRNGISIVKEGLNFGLINKDGEELLTVEWKQITQLPTGKYLVINHNGKAGLVDGSGRFLVRPTYDSIQDTGQFLIIENDGKKGTLDYKGNQKLKLIYSDVRYNNGFILLMN